MQTVKIRRPEIDDAKEAAQFFRTVIRDTFQREGLEDKLEDIVKEIETKKEYFRRDIASDGRERYFLFALIDNRIVGTIEYGPASGLIDRLTAGVLKELVEIGTVFVHPEYQGQGIGRLLLNAIFLTLLSRGIEEFCLDSGYVNAQKI